MEQSTPQFIVAAGKHLVELLHGNRITPAAAIEAYADLALQGPSRDKLVQMLTAHWAMLNSKQAEAGSPELDPAVPRILSRGYDTMVPEEELRGLLPEEKILINREAFHSLLDAIDFSSLDASRERAILEQLKADAIGLNPEDIILYYNLIKVNRLAARNRLGSSATAIAGPNGNQETQQGSPVSLESRDPGAQPASPTEIFALAMKAFAVKQEQITKANSGKALVLEQFYTVMQESMRRRRIDPEVYAHYLGKYTDKYVRALREFMERSVTQRGENPADFAAYQMLYILVGGNEQQLIDLIEPAPPLAAYLTDRVGRIRSVYYVSMLFIHTFLYALCAQSSDIALKYRASPPDQQAKLRKLYSSSERLGLLLSNATTMANQRVAEYKVDVREIQGHFKQFLMTHRELLDPNDLFGSPLASGTRA